MSDILSQNEINELLAALASGNDEPVEDVREEEPASEAKPYNFKTANKFSKEQIRMLRFIHENFAGRLATYLSGTLRAVTEVEVVSVEEQTYGEFNNSLPSPTFLAIYNMPPLAGSSLMELSPTISFEIISRLFGGGKSLVEADDANKVYTEIEVAILQRIAQQMISVMDESWERITDVRSYLDRVETNAQFAQIVSASEPISIITLNVKIGEVSDLVNICIPHLAIQPIAKQLAKTAWYDERGGIGSGEDVNIDEMTPRIKNTELTLHAVLNNTIATIHDVISLQVGDVIRMDHPTDRDITMLVEHIPKFKGKLGVTGKKLAIKITDILKEVTEDV
ncbi:flagellar motor switch protein FliM [Clostridia bacterium OttesenSCG-928-F22]|nr:flagellar motor switch protein FliM [Clostridia bacterium OttesenSCG-928-F22]